MLSLWSFDSCAAIPIGIDFHEFCMLMSFDSITMNFYAASPWSHPNHVIDFKFPFVRLKMLEPWPIDFLLHALKNNFYEHAGFVFLPLKITFYIIRNNYFSIGLILLFISACFPYV
uniref:Uncharacterized protein n=1 Tax=Setaria viridis TaxID=4556 RepID=A0A4U6VJC9_SETVI|nr:hypothetical protein SEVIR_3G343500v2 [Setaria viridis]